ncbi:DUF4397 domain-containing protein [Clostridium aestuarii]|uniref:DUF4397 domain-containing protein n=1 Tax=Clostridium aestuarii TaxID=338193 RepID=A0ABT4D0K9_9CLOT|nr:DUF4397 domain-containing protein [Clostridium aestuarii]MCY6484632.1 DUF4397 domain-containing protein [Clostridium aestuarii]
MFSPLFFRTPMTAFVRVFHASPDAPPVDIYANGKILVKNLKYKYFTEYLKIPAGNYNIKVFPAGKTTNPVIDTYLSIKPETIYTVAATGMLKDIKLLPFIDPILPMEDGKTYVRFGHLSPNTPRVDITLPDGTILFDDVGFEEITDYIPVAPKTYTIQAREAGTSNIALTIPNIKLKPNRFYTIYAVGLLGKKPPLQVLIPLDGNSYIDF